MTEAEKALDNFDEDGRFIQRPAVWPVTFFRKDSEGENKDCSGTLVFNDDGHCIAATLDDGAPQRLPNDAPISGKYILHFKGEDDALVLLIHDGRLLAHYEMEESPLPPSGTFRGQPPQRQMPKSGYVMRNDNARNTVSTIDASTPEDAQKLCDHLKSSNVQCHVDGPTVEIDDLTPYGEVKLAFERFLGYRF